MKLKAEHMRTLPDFFSQINDPRQAAGKRHPLPTVLALATAAVLCGMKGYKGICDWVEALSPKARARFKCCYREGKYIVPSESTIRNVLIRVDPMELDQAFQAWNAHYGSEDSAIAIDGKTMCNATDNAGKQAHIMSVIGHTSHQCYTQKK
jgi:hypothetical protein